MTIFFARPPRFSMLLVYIRSTLFFIWFALASVVIAVGGVWVLLLPRRATEILSKTWSRAVLFGLKWIAGLDYEVRGPVPRGAVLIAAKHMSMWDTVVLYLLLDDAAAVVKRSLLNVPFYGWYLWKAGVIAIDRDGRASALKQMVAEAKAIVAEQRPIFIFPEGTRKEPGAAPDYKPGVAALYTQIGVSCVPVALNSGLFWTGPMGFLKKPGTVVVEFLPSIPSGLKRAEFMETLQNRIESATAKLLVEGRQILASKGLS
ncbi:MAG TPA: lysophospholipid acyltransferase family protein [Rhizomicrobium sp.]|nr:lysophospholipid acyltransferase family protein [Rhizomicrobium sp.]